MASLPLIRTTKPGIYRVCTVANTDYAIAIPAGAVGCIVWFETSTTNAALVGGRIGMDEANTAVTSLTGTDDLMGYHPAMPVQYELNQRSTRVGGVPVYERDAFLHVASATAGAVVRGMWLFTSDEA